MNAIKLTQAEIETRRERRSESEHYDFESVLSCWHRLLRMVPRDLREFILADPSLKYEVGLTKEYQPVTWGFTGKVRKLDWHQFMLLVNPDAPQLRPWLRNSDYCADSWHMTNEERIRQGCHVWDCAAIRSYIALQLTIEDVKPHLSFRSGREIFAAFRDERPGSCMAHCPEWTQLYANNPDTVGVLVLDMPLFGGKSSWLMWSINGIRVFDKAYSCQGGRGLSAVKATIGKEMGAVTGEDRPGSVELKWVDGHRLPYMDTYCNCDSWDDRNETITLNRQGIGHLVQNHEHGWHPTELAENMVECECCGAQVHEDDYYYTDADERLCECCYGSCELTDITGRREDLSEEQVCPNQFGWRPMWVFTENLRDYVYSDHHCGYIYEDWAIYADGDYFTHDDIGELIWETEDGEYTTEEPTEDGES